MTKHKHTVAKEHHHHHQEKKKKQRYNPFAWVASGVVLFGLLFIAANYAVSDDTMRIPNDIQQAEPTKPPSPVTDEEKKKIDQWITDSNVNEYGDPKNTIYIGGTPLFNEATGKYRNLYDYILERHPDRPWL